MGHFIRVLSDLTHPRRVLIAVAAPAEAAAVAELFHISPPSREGEVVQLVDTLDLVRTGVGKTPAAVTIGAICARHDYGLVLNLGIAGALPVAQPLDLHELVIATAHAFADEGVALPPTTTDSQAMTPLHAMGFGPDGTVDGAVPGDVGVISALSTALPRARRGPIATVSTCSGRDDLSRAVVARTGAIAEAMEGAAVALAARRAGVRYGEVRVVSNTTGDRDRQRWSIGPALAVLSDLLAE
jgi:futalosine hydrolase